MLQHQRNIIFFNLFQAGIKVGYCLTDLPQLWPGIIM